MRKVAVNEEGLRIGEDHPNANLSDADVDLIRDLHEEDGLTYETLAEKFEVSKWAIGRICRYERRAQTPSSHKRVLDANDYPHVQELQEQGYRRFEICEKLGVSERLLRMAIKQMNPQQEQNQNAARSDLR